MKIFVIGSAVYKKEIEAHIKALKEAGHEAAIAAYDDVPGNEFVICSYNKGYIQWADTVHVFWDSRSIGTQFDVGMAFALDKPIEIIKLNPKTLRNFMLRYNQLSREGVFGTILGFGPEFGGRDYET